MEDGRFFFPLGQSSGIRVPADIPHPKGPPQDTRGSGVSSADSYSVVQEAVVPGANGPPSGSPQDSPNPPGPDSPAGIRGVSRDS